MFGGKRPRSGRVSSVGVYAGALICLFVYLFLFIDLEGDVWTSEMRERVMR